MATAPDRVDPVFGDALAGDGGMTDPMPSAVSRDPSLDVFPDALSALPLPALTLVLPPLVDPGAAGPAESAVRPAVSPTRPAVPPVRPAAASRQSAVRAPSRPAAASVLPAPPIGPGASGYPPPARPAAAQPAAIATAAPYSRPAALPRQTRPVPVTSSARGVLASGRPPVARVAATIRPPASTPAAVRPAPPAGRRRSTRASSAWALLVFIIISLAGSGQGQRLVHAISQLLHHR